MPLQTSFEEQELLADMRRHRVGGLTSKELLVELALGAAFVVGIGVLWCVRPPQAFNHVAATLSVAVMILATQVSFETPLGFTPATQLAFVPLVFALPGATMPLAVLVVLIVARLPEVLRGRTHPVKLLQTPGNAWFSLGPALVFALAGVRPSEAGPMLMLAALGGQFAADFAAAIFSSGVARGATLRSQIHDSRVYLIDAALSAGGLVLAEQMRDAPCAVLAAVPLLGLLAMFAQERRGRLDKLLELNDTYRGTALLLGDVISADDGYTGDHSQGVVGLALAVGDALGLDAERRRNLEFGAMLHDVGKIAVPKEIINKPGNLSPDEWEIIKTHPAVGERMLNRVGGFMVQVGEIVRHHHERWDGGGYPDGLTGEAIPLESRIITCCDSWSAMRTDRSYRRALSYETAMEQMRVNAGSQFDPVLVEALVQVVSVPGSASAGVPETAASAPTPATVAALV